VSRGNGGLTSNHADDPLSAGAAAHGAPPAGRPPGTRRFDGSIVERAGRLRNAWWAGNREPLGRWLGERSRLWSSRRATRRKRSSIALLTRSSA